MASKQNRQIEYVEIGSEPEYFVSVTRYETMSDGNIRRYAYVERGRELHLIHTEVIPARALMVMGQKAMRISQDEFNAAMFEDEMTEH